MKIRVRSSWISGIYKATELAVSLNKGLRVYVDYIEKEQAVLDKHIAHIYFNRLCDKLPYTCRLTNKVSRYPNGIESVSNLEFGS